MVFTSLTSFTKNFIGAFNKHKGIIKEIYVPINHANFLRKNLQKAIMLRSRLRNIISKENSVESKKVYYKQRNSYVSMVKKSNKEHFQKINLSEIVDNKKCWKTVRPLFGNNL